MEAANSSSAEPALQPNNVKQLPALVEEISGRVQALANGGDVDRRDLIAKCRSLVHCLESPRELMLRDCWGQVNSKRVVGRESANLKVWRNRCHQLWRRHGAMDSDGEKRQQGPASIRPRLVSSG